MLIHYLFVCNNFSSIWISLCLSTLVSITKKFIKTKFLSLLYDSVALFRIISLSVEVHLLKMFMVWFDKSLSIPKGEIEVENRNSSWQCNGKQKKGQKRKFEYNQGKIIIHKLKDRPYIPSEIMFWKIFFIYFVLHKLIFFILTVINSICYYLRFIMKCRNLCCCYLNTCCKL